MRIVEPFSIFRARFSCKEGSFCTPLDDFGRRHNKVPRIHHHNLINRLSRRVMNPPPPQVSLLDLPDLVFVVTESNEASA